MRVFLVLLMITVFAFADAYIDDHQEAVQQFTQAIKSDPNNVNAYVNRGNSYDELDDHINAINDYTQAIKLDKNSAEAYYYRGNSY